MPENKPSLLYLCSDRGIPFGGSKGGSVHIREFLEALVDEGVEAEVVVCRLEKEAQYRPNYPVNLVSPGDCDSFFDYAARLGYSRRAFREVHEFYRNEAVAATVRRICKRTPPELIYERYSLYGIAGLTMARELNIPHVLEVNAPLVREASEFRQLNLPDLARAVEQFVFSGADHIIAVSKQVADYVHAVTPDASVTVVPNGVNPRLHDSPADTSLWREKLEGETSAELVLGFVGSIRPWHGVHILIDALADLLKREVNVSLALVGDNQMILEELLSQSARLGIADRLIFTGAVPFESIPSVIAAIDILVAPYPRMDEFYFSPLKIFEYMAAGKPIVASDIGQITDVLADGKNGLLVTPGDPRALAEAVFRLYNDKQLADSISARARKDVELHHTWSSRIREILSVFRELGRFAGEIKAGKPCG